MLITQIEYFLEVARCLSFSEASRNLYITQPTLSRQITSIEAELNMQLFIRSYQGLKLTPAGVVLYEEFSSLMKNYKNGIQNAQMASHGYLGQLRIGILDSLDVSFVLTDIMDKFEKDYPNIRIVLSRHSYGGLVDLLRKKELDAAISLDFNFMESESISYRSITPFHPVWAVPYKNPLSQKESLQYSDFKGQELVIVGEQDCYTGVHTVIELFQKYGRFHPDFYFVDSMENVLLWVENSSKCALLCEEFSISRSEHVRTYPVVDDEDSRYIVIAWNPGTENFARNLLLNFFPEQDYAF